jgi:ABC-type transport system involved in Fe-S cluster assembly fused permease/ATPase subunit
VNSASTPEGFEVQEAPEYGSIDQACEPEAFVDDDAERDADTHSSDDEDDEDPIDRLPKDNWLSYAQRFSIFLPILWPKGEKTHQLRIVGCLLCLVATRLLNLLEPRQTGIVIDTLTKSANRGFLNGSSWLWIGPIALLALYGWLNSSSGFPLIRTYLWIPVENRNLQKLHTLTYNHIMELSSDFHDSKQSGKLWYSMWKGYSVNSFLELVLFEILPVVFDFVLAAIYIYFALDPYLALIVFGTSIFYLWSTTAMIPRLTNLRRSERELDKSEYEIMTETMSNWRTVSYFNRVPHEESRYSSASWSCKEASTLLEFWYEIEQAVKATIMELGLFSMLIVSGYRVIHGAPVGDVVVLLQLWNRIAQPLAVIADSFTRIASDLVDAEDLVKVLEKKPSVRDDKDAKPLDLKQGGVEFESVNFSYDKERHVLKDISFRVIPGQTVALVGETGGGKSTILKLIFRFYDVTSGSIKIDGQDIRKVTIRSLRDIIGNVPQDVTLFNDTILSNVRYARLDATDEDVIEACKAAAIHDKIMSFPKRYQSKVGERGTKLSGGELQRIAIARAFLQNPRIVLLDEATSSVDTETEAHIQQSLKRLTSGHTTFVIAHRLSTIINADLILVVRGGEIVERGTHQELVEAKGQYYNLWTKQILSPNTETGDTGSRKGGQASDSLSDLPAFDVFKPKLLAKGSRRSTWHW